MKSIDEPYICGLEELQAILLSFDILVFIPLDRMLYTVVA